MSVETSMKTPETLGCIISYTSSSSIASESGSTRRTLRERCGFTLWLSLAPAFPNIPAKGHLEPSAGNIPRRRKRSSVASFELPAPVKTPAPVARIEYFA